jgi:hypothetical protein
MEGLYTNRHRKKESLQNAFERYGRNCEVRIASAFFTADEVIEDFVKNGCTVRLIVRLGAGTRADALARALLNREVRIEYFTYDSGFHTKMYQFGGSACLVGSANLTGAGKWTNPEVVVMVPPEDPRFDELRVLFEEYWDKAAALDTSSLERYRRLERENRPILLTGLDTAVEKEFGKVLFDGIERPEGKKTPIERYIRDFASENKAFREAFREIQTIYEGKGLRMAAELPLRFEIDQLLNFIREECATGESYLEVPILSPAERKVKIESAIEGFRYANHAELEKIGEHKIPTLLACFRSKEAIEESSEDKIFDALVEIYAFHDQLHYLGGPQQAKSRFFRENPVDRVRKTISFLLHAARPDAVTRMAMCIHDVEYELRLFKQGCVEELFGWINNEDVPLCNGRALKSIRWLGFRLKNA